MGDYRDKVIYQIYTKSFNDTNGDGLGDIRGVTEKLDYLKELGIDYIWMTPFFTSPLMNNYSQPETDGGSVKLRPYECLALMI
jgi:trehalose-6-phosphate hydrolase